MTMAKKTDTPPTFQTSTFAKNFPSDAAFSYSQYEELKKLLKRTTEERSLLLLTGQAGVGKTTAVRSFTDDLPTNKYQVLYVGQDQEGINLSRRLAAGLGIPPQRSKAHTWLLISQFLSDNFREQGKEIVLIVDEAHLLENVTLQEIRLLTNADFDRTTPLTLFMIGQLSLRTRLKMAGQEALNQRLRFRYALEGLTEEETSDYINHRLRIAGISDEVFTDDALRTIFLASQGIPREINNICTVAMMQAETLGVSLIDGKLIRQVVDQREAN
jgi:type II secretory pathway predicted ATPase ExeA